MEDFSAKSGSYNAPYLTENQADTLSGVFDATFLEYPKDKAKELFERIVDLVPSAPQVMTTALFVCLIVTKKDTAAQVNHHAKPQSPNLSKNIRQLQLRNSQ